MRFARLAGTAVRLAGFGAGGDGHRRPGSPGTGNALHVRGRIAQARALRVGVVLVVPQRLKRGALCSAAVVGGAGFGGTSRGSDRSRPPPCGWRGPRRLSMPMLHAGAGRERQHGGNEPKCADEAISPCRSSGGSNRRCSISGNADAFYEFPKNSHENFVLLFAPSAPHIDGCEIQPSRDHVRPNQRQARAGIRPQPGLPHARSGRIRAQHGAGGREEHQAADEFRPATRPSTRPNGSFDPLNISGAFMALLGHMAANPAKVIEAQFELWSDYLNLWQRTAERMMGGSAPSRWSRPPPPTGASATRTGRTTTSSISSSNRIC